MITLSRSQRILIIFQVSHDELLERKVNEVNPITIERKAFVRRSLNINKNPFFCFDGEGTALFQDTIYLPLS